MIQGGSGPSIIYLRDITYLALEVKYFESRCSHFAVLSFGDDLDFATLRLVSDNLNLTDNCPIW